jgi:hypothetical protein
MAGVKKSMSVPMALLDLRHRTLLETDRALKRRILTLGLWPGCFLPQYPSPADVTIERIYSGPDRALCSEPRKIVYGLPVSVFLKGHEVTSIESEGGERSAWLR